MNRLEEIQTTPLQENGNQQLVVREVHHHHHVQRVPEPYPVVRTEYSGEVHPAVTCLAIVGGLCVLGWLFSRD